MAFSVLKWTQGKMQVRLKTYKKCANVTDHSYALYGGFISIYVGYRSTYLLQIWVSQDAFVLVHCLAMNSGECLAHDVIDTSATHTGAVHVTDTDCQAWIVSTHGHIFVTFKHFFLIYFFNKLYHKLAILYIIYKMAGSPFYMSLWSIGHLMLFLAWGLL